MIDLLIFHIVYITYFKKNHTALSILQNKNTYDSISSIVSSEQEERKKKQYWRIKYRFFLLLLPLLFLYVDISKLEIEQRSAIVSNVLRRSR